MLMKGMLIGKIRWSFLLGMVGAERITSLDSKNSYEI